MNIFVLSSNPIKAAQMMCDKHVIKMILESAQILCSVFPQGEAPYKRTHYNHPSVIWSRENESNYNWLISHGLALCNEYEYRYGKIHKSKDVILWCKKNIHRMNLKKEKLSSFAKVVPEQYINLKPINAYRCSYLNEKKTIAKWTKRKPPSWWN